MTKQEMIELLYFILRDMRGSFPKSKDDIRIDKARELSIELGFENITYSIDAYISTFDEFGGDGRWFREDYENISSAYKITNLYNIKSDEFKRSTSILHYPEFAFVYEKENKNK